MEIHPLQTCSAALADQEYNTSFGSQPGHHKDDHSQSTYTCIDVPAAQASEVVGSGGIFLHLDAEAAHGPDPRKPGGTVQQQALPELSSTWSVPSCEWRLATYLQDGYNTAMPLYTIQAQHPLPEAYCEGAGNGKGKGKGSRQWQRQAKAAARQNDNENTW